MEPMSMYDYMTRPFTLTPEQARVRELLNYDPDTGVFEWRVRRSGVRINKRLGTDNGNGYLRITVDGVSQYAHRLAWLYVYGSFPAGQIDHINGIASDNRICNLRAATPSQNQQNKHSAQSNNKHGVRGVSWHAMANKWQAHIAVDGKHIYLGLYSSISDAVRAYKNARVTYHPFAEASCQS